MSASSILLDDGNNNNDDEDEEQVVEIENEANYWHRWIDNITEEISNIM